MVHGLLNIRLELILISVANVHPTATEGVFEVNGDCLSLTNMRSTIVLLLLTVTKHVPSAAMQVKPNEYSKSRKK